MSKSVYSGIEWKVSEGDGNVYLPQIETLADGNRVFAYQQGTDLQFAIYNSNNRQLFSGTIAGDTDAATGSLKLLAQSDGGFLVAWHQADSTRIQRFDAGGDTVGDPVIVNGLDTFSGAIADLGEGNFAFASKNTETGDWILNRVVDGGELLAEPLEIGTAADMASMQVLESGAFLFIETRQETSESTVDELVIIDADGIRSSSRTLTGDVVELASLGNGGYAVLSTHDDRLYLQFIDEQGSLLGDATAVVDPFAYGGTLKLVAMDDGAFAVIFDASGTPASTDNVSDVFGLTFNSSGEATSEIFRINQVSDHAQSVVDASYIDGKLTVVWSDFRNGADALNAIYAQDITVSGSDGDNAPTGILVSTLEIAENTQPGSVVGVLEAVDSTLGDTFYYDFLSDSDWFEIIDDTIVVQEDAVLDYEKSSGSEELEIRVTDSEGNEYSEIFEFVLSDVFEPIYGTDKNDKLNGSRSSEAIYGLGGNDKIDGKAGTDTLYGGDGNDTYIISSSVGSKTLVELKGEGKDTVKTVLGHELGDNFENLVILGKGNVDATGNDLANKIIGNKGNNVISGGGGGDDLKGGGGKDVFFFAELSDSTAKAGGRDEILDFSSKQHDVINLHDIDARAGTNNNDAFRFIGKKQFTDHEGELRYQKAGKDTLLQADVDGDGKADFSIELDGRHELQFGDFIL